MGDKGGDKKLYRLAAREEGCDLDQVNDEDEEGKVLVDEISIARWQRYFHKLLNEEGRRYQC
ncbi:hypothetical protein H5410_019266 [Solanum commersonii]|uniref:Uncharacterized protein n=1 Tax=Solanum commersonii TaxID=4109 RepID=A0A9J6A506_SOLCO|nr:hypothetical protein H5410_019266 [Solanum commersonii]